MEERQKACLAVAACACTVLCLVSSTSAFSHGASPSACADMMPKHLRAQLHSPTNNYVTIHTNVSFYVPGDKIPVTVRSSRDFMGFLLQARKVSNDETAGTFVFIPPGSKLLSCFEDGDTVTHSDKSLKRNLSFVWKAPDQPIGDIKFFISVVQSYFVYWARIESATVSTSAPLLLFAVSVLLGSGSSTAIPSSLPYTSPAPVSLASITPTPALGSGIGVHSDMQPTAEPTQLSQSLWGASSRSGGSSPTSSSGLEPSLAFQEPGMADALQSFLFRDHTSRQSLSDRYSWFSNEDTVSNLSLAWRQMAESKPPRRSEEGEEEEEVIKEVGGHTLPWATRAGPKPAVPGVGDDSRRGTRLIAAQLGILLVCTAVLGLAAAAGLRYICARYCHKRTEVSFSEPGNNVIAVKDNGEMMHFRKIRENSFVLVQAEYNWISPPSSGKRRIM
uniref:Reeler domain containing 1 n=1 Tax=Pavo cristatus TaxID=9049 RepID=A0A8C9FKE8_PAVCR